MTHRVAGPRHLWSVVRTQVHPSKPARTPSHMGRRAQPGFPRVRVGQLCAWDSFHQHVHERRWPHTQPAHPSHHTRPPAGHRMDQQPRLQVSAAFTWSALPHCTIHGAACPHPSYTRHALPPLAHNVHTLRALSCSHTRCLPPRPPLPQINRPHPSHHTHTHTHHIITRV